MSRRTLLFLSVAFLVPLGCDVVTPRPETDLRAEIEGQRAAWEERGFRDYSFILRRSCFCPPLALGPARVHVEQGTVVRVADPESGEEFPADHWHLFPAIEGVFSILLDAVDRDADEVDLEWHEDLAYPRSAFVDYSRSTADEEIGFEVSAVEARDEP
ncbi:MAG: DUF6174 domain-containing protein [Gemmatimonadota bacterium]